MKVTIDFGREIEPAVQAHLGDVGVSVQSYIRAALAFFNDTLRVEQAGGNCIGYGDKSRFKSYNTEMSPTTYLYNSDYRER